MNVRLVSALGAVIAALSFAPPVVAQGKYDAGASDTEIKIGQTMPFSGPVSANSTIGKVEAAYFRMINEHGGINGRKINLISYDDAYSPPKTVEQIRKLAESDEVLFMFQILGTAPNAAVQKYLNQKKVPQLFSATGANRFFAPEAYPWTMGFNPSYQTEARVYARYIIDNYPDARIGVLYQNDDLGKDYLVGLKAGLGEKAAGMIVAEVSYEVAEPTIASQVARLKSSGADLVLDVATPKFAAQAIRMIGELGWKPTHIVNINATAVEAVMKPAGLEYAQDMISINYLKDPADLTWANDQGMQSYLTFMERYFPDGDRFSTLNSYGYTAAQLVTTVLRRCGDDLTRENVMKQATNLKGVQSDLYLPGITANTSSTDYKVNKSFRMMRFKGQSWQLFGPIISE